GGGPAGCPTTWSIPKIGAMVCALSDAGIAKPINVAVTRHRSAPAFSEGVKLLTRASPSLYLTCSATLTSSRPTDMWLLYSTATTVPDVDTGSVPRKRTSASIVCAFSHGIDSDRRGRGTRGHLDTPAGVAHRCDGERA